MEQNRKIDNTRKIGRKFFSKFWKENAVDETDKNENADSKVSTTVGGSGDTIQEDKTGYGISLQLSHATFKMVDNQSFHAEIAMADESIIYDVCDNSTAQELVMSDTFIDGQVLHI